MVAGAAGQAEAHAPVTGAADVERGGHHRKHNPKRFALLDAAPRVLEASEECGSFCSAGTLGVCSGTPLDAVLFDF